MPTAEVSEDRLVALEARLLALDELPVQAHPDVLEEVAVALVAELDELAARTDARSSRS